MKLAKKISDTSLNNFNCKKSSSFNGFSGSGIGLTP